MVRDKRRFGKTANNYKLEDIWADSEEISGTIQKMETNYPTLKKKIFVITEGPYDYEFYSRFFSGDICEIRFANSKKNVISILNKINENMPNKASDSIIGIVDRDFSFFTNNCEQKMESKNDPSFFIENLFMTDTHDIETMIISEDLIKKILDYYKTRTAGGSFQRSMLSAVRQKDILTQLVESCRLLGLSLYVNEKYGLNMTFKHINCKKKNAFLEFTDTSDIRFDEEKFLSLIYKRNTDKFDKFKTALSAELSGDTDYFSHPMQICRGHDLMCVLLADINANYPQISGEKVRSRDLERLFRNFYDRNEFFRTELFKKIKKWADDNKEDIREPLFRNSEKKLREYSYS